jgi:hypothetical protein
MQYMVTALETARSLNGYYVQGFFNHAQYIQVSGLITTDNTGVCIRGRDVQACLAMNGAALDCA